jgi:hypothetical protein
MQGLPDLSEFEFETAVQSLMHYLLEGEESISWEDYESLSTALTIIVTGFRNETGNLEIAEEEKQYFDFYANVIEEAKRRLNPAGKLN